MMVAIRHVLSWSLLLASCGAEDIDIDVQVQASMNPGITPQTAYASDLGVPQDAHYTYIGQAGLVGSGKLVVFLPGMGGHPAGYQTFLQHANDLGFHVIGLSYWDTSNLTGEHRIDQLCDLDDDGMELSESACWAQAHQEMFDCSATASPFQTPAMTCIKERLDHLLDYLSGTYPYTMQHWDQFVENGHPKWSSIVLAGHSMGAGNAAWIAQRRDVHRLVMLAQPADYVYDASGTSIPADWIDDGFNSLLSADMYGLAHTGDTTALFSRTFENWGVFGMSGQYCMAGPCVNQICSPLLGQYCGAHKLFSKLAATDPHNIVAQDEASYGSAWTYLLTHQL